MHVRAERVARGWIVGLVATTVAAVSHSLAGGYQPGVLSFGAALVFAGLLGTVVISRRPSLPRLIVAVGGSQLAFHLLFSLLGSGHAISTVPTGGSGPMQMGGMSQLGGMSQSSPIAASSMSDHLTSPSMWIAHAVAAALTVLFLRRAEFAVWRMLARLATLVVARIASAAVPVLSAERPQLLSESFAIAPLRSRQHITSARRRGPPLLAF